MTTTPTLRDAAQALLDSWNAPFGGAAAPPDHLMKNLQAALAAPADALAEPAAFRMRYRSEPGMIGHYPWSYLELARRSKTPHPAHEYEDLYTAPPATQLQQAVARAVEKCAAICIALSDQHLKDAESAHERQRYEQREDHRRQAAIASACAAAIRAKGQQ